MWTFSKVYVNIIKFFILMCLISVYKPTELRVVLIIYICTCVNICNAHMTPKYLNLSLYFENVLKINLDKSLVWTNLTFTFIYGSGVLVLLFFTRFYKIIIWCYGCTFLLSYSMCSITKVTLLRLIVMATNRAACIVELPRYCLCVGLGMERTPRVAWVPILLPACTQCG